jgi:hypothetical protein
MPLESISFEYSFRTVLLVQWVHLANFWITSENNFTVTFSSKFYMNIRFIIINIIMTIAWLSAVISWEEISVSVIFTSHNSKDIYWQLK